METMTKDRKVSVLELFFDLVFVFAFTQVTLGLANDATWAGLGRGGLVFLLLWWAWGAYAWLTSVMESMRRGPRVVVLLSMAAMLLAAFAVPRALADGGLVFAVSWTIVMILHAALFRLATDPGSTTTRAIVQIGSGNIVAGLMLVAASFTDGAATTLIFVLAATIAYATPYTWGVGGFSISPAHFAERHNLIVIVALGESIVAAGAGAGEIVFDWSTVAAVLLAIALVSALWWAYFDTTTHDVERSLAGVAGLSRTKMARDVYSYLHIPLVLGIVYAALGLKSTLGHVDEPLAPVAVAAFCGGVALFFLALSAIRRRCGLRVGGFHVIGLVGALAAIPIALHVDAVASLAVLAAIASIAGFSRLPAPVVANSIGTVATS